MPFVDRLLAVFRRPNTASAAWPHQAFPLVDADPAQALRIVALMGGRTRCDRLRDRGIVEDRIVRVEQRRALDGVVVAADDARIALDAESAAAVRVAAVADAPPATRRRPWELTPGERAVVRGLADGAPAYRAKLLAMGLLPGTSIELVRTAPLGDPLELRVRGYELSLRRAEAAVLELEEAA